MEEYLAMNRLVRQKGFQWSGLPQEDSACLRNTLGDSFLMHQRLGLIQQ